MSAFLRFRLSVNRCGGKPISTTNKIIEREDLDAWCAVVREIACSAGVCCVSPGQSRAVSKT